MSEIVDCIAWIVRKTCWSLAIFFRFILYRLLDLFGLIFNLLACATIIRLPAMFMQFQIMDDLWEWRFMGFVQFLIFISDIPVFVMGCILLVTIWRVYPCYNELRKEWDGKWKRHGIYYTGFAIRGVIIKHFFTLFIDVVCVPTGLMCLLSWRCKIFVKRIQDASNDWKRRKYCFVEFLHLLIDIPLLLCFLITLLSWRMPFVIRHIKKDRSKNRSWTGHIRYRGIQHFFYLFLDLPCLIMLLLSCLTWRLPFVIRRVKQPTEIWKKKTQKKMRVEITLEFLSIFIDIPCMIIVALVTVTLWRLYFLVKKVKKIFYKSRDRKLTREDEMEIRLACLEQLGLLLIDLACLILFIIVCCTLWRLYPLAVEIKKYSKQYQNWRAEQNRVETKNIDKTASTEELSVENNETNNDSNSQENEIEPNENENSEDNAIKTCTLTKCMWKIRKAICINFVMILVDVPAIILFLFLLITLLRASKVISAVIGSGNFYLLFAVTVYHQTALFFIDFLFFLLFLVLIIWRPIAVWIHLFEDEEHMKSRILKDEIIPWGQDVIKSREKCLNSLNDHLAVAIKERIPYPTTRDKLMQIFETGYYDKLTELSDELEKYQIQEEYVNVLNTIKFYESNRVTKLMRKYLVESVYLQRADVRLHNANVAKYKAEMKYYESKLNDLYKEMSNYKADQVPLYEEKCGLKIRSSKETKKILIKCLTGGNFVFIVSLLLACLPLYRAPRMFISIHERWCARLDIVKQTLKEYGLDFLAFLQMLFVIILVYRAPFMIVDIADCIIERRSVKAVRNVIKTYPPEILEDFVSLASFIFSWNTPRLFFTTILFTILMPADLFLSVIRMRYNDKCKAYFFTIVMYLFFIASPFIIVYYASEELLNADKGWMNIILVSAFFCCLFAVVATLILGIVRTKNREYLLEVPPADYVRYTWYNIHIFIFEFLEFIQGIALIYKLRDIPMYGSDTMHSISEYVLFSFFSFKTIFWITVALFCVWFLICGAPIILENILETLPVDTCSKRSSWRLAVSLFANTLFLTMIESFMSMNACYYYTCPEVSNALVILSDNMTHTNNTCTLSELVDDKEIACWTDHHAPYSLFDFLGVTWYLSTAIIFIAKYGDPSTFEQDIGFSPIYNTIINILKGFMVLSTTIVTEEKYVSVALFVLFNLLAVIFTFCFRALFKYQPCNFLSVLVWRLFSFTAAIVAAISVLTAFLMDDFTSKVPIIVLVVGIAVCFIIALFCAVKLQQESEIIKHRNSFRKNVLIIESKIKKNKWFIEAWDGQSKTWKRLAKSVKEASKMDRNYNSENWNIDKIFGQAETKDTEFVDYVKPPPLPPTGSTTDYQPPPLPPAGSATDYQPPPIPPAASATDYQPPPLPPAGSTIAYQPPPIGPPPPIELLSPKTDPTSSSDEYQPPPTGSNEENSDETLGDKQADRTESTKNNENLKEEPNNNSDEQGINSNTSSFAETTFDDSPVTTVPDQQSESNEKGKELPAESPCTERSPLYEQQESYDSFRLNMREKTNDDKSEDESSESDTNSIDDTATADPNTVHLIPDISQLKYHVEKLEKNGRNLLIMLEKHIRYDAFRYSFLAQRNHWLNAVWESNWQGLAHCLEILESNLLGTFDKPSQLDIQLSPPSLPSDELKDDPHDSLDLPPKVKKLTKQERIDLSNNLRAQIIEDMKSLTNYGNELSDIFKILLPELPVMTSWKCENNSFELHCRRGTTGVITEIGDGGNKLAKGASFSIGKHLQGYVTNDEINFSADKSVVGKKGPVSAVVKDLSFFKKKETLYVSVNGKKVKYELIKASCKTIKWS